MLGVGLALGKHRNEAVVGRKHRILKPRGSRESYTVEPSAGSQEAAQL